MPQESTQSTPSQQLEQLVEQGDAVQIQGFLQALSSGELAHTIARMDEGKQAQLLVLLPAASAAQLVDELTHAQAAELIEQLPSERAAAIVDEMASDEQADLIGELDEEDANAILEHMSPEEAADVRRLSQYGPDTAGGIMITEYLVYPQHLTTNDILADLKHNTEKYTSYDVQYLYIVSSNTNELMGTVRFRDLVMSAGLASITSVMRPQTHSVQATADLDQLEEFFDHLGFHAAPVVDEQGRLVGVVRRAHVQEALADRADKAMLRLGGIIGGEEFRTMPVITRATRRLAFLAPNIGLNLLAVSVIAVYEPLLAKVSALMIFLPILSDMSGCSGNQAVAVSMRELALGLVKPFEVIHVLLKEISLGLINGLVLGVALGTIAWIMRGDAYPYLGLVVGGAMVVNSLVAVCVGGAMPLLLKSIKVDPALAAGPLLTTMTDLCGFFFALTFAKLMLELTGTA